MSTSSQMSIKDAEKPQAADATLAYGVADIDDSSSDDELLAYSIPPEEHRKLLRRLDSFLAPMVMILYLISFLDRSNIGAASTAGMFKDIHAPVNGLSVATSIFYATYVSFEPFFTTILKSVRPSILLPAVTTCWGAVVIGNAFIKNYASLLACRLLLGFLESALTPCLFLALTFFYQRNELAWRTALMFVSAATSGVAGGLVGAGLTALNGRLGLSGWSHLYLWEGVLTVVVGLLSPLLIADSPAKAWWLSPRQKLLMRARYVQARQYTGSESFSWLEVRKAVKEPLVYVSGFIQLGFDICLYGFSTFCVVIVKGLGYNSIHSQLLTAPIYAWAAIVYLVAAHICDKHDVRFWLVLPVGLITCIGYILLIAVQHSTAVSLFACFLCATGIYTAVGINVSWLNSNVAGVRKRSTAIGVQQLLGNCGGIVAGQIYRSKDSPHYRLGHAVSLGAMGCALVTMCGMVWMLKRRDVRKDAMTEDEKRQQDEDGVTGDEHWSFRFVY